MKKEKAAKIGLLREKLSKFPKSDLNNFLTDFATPIQYLKNVSEDLGLEVIVKREDLNGPAYGGHYTNGLEYVFGEILNSSYDSIVHGGPSQSNHSRLIAAACAKFGIKAHLVLRKKLTVDMKDIGNLFLDKLSGADIRLVKAEMGAEIDKEKERWYNKIIKEGKENPYLFQRERNSFLNCLGMLDLFLKMYEQLDEINKIPATIYLCGCGPTHSGILLGTKLIDSNISVVGVRPLHWDAQQIVSKEFNIASKNLGENVRINPKEVVNYAEYVGEDYGIPTKESSEAFRYFHKKEGLVFDPIYMGKMAACFLDNARNGKIEKGTRVLLIHSGGTPLLLLYSREIYKILGIK